MQQEPEVCAALANPGQKKTARQSALTVSNDDPSEQLETPDQLELLAKRKATSVRHAFKTMKQRSKAVAATASINGTDDLSAELRQKSTDSSVTNETNNTVNTSVANPPKKKQKRNAVAPALIVTTIASLPASPPKTKCQGCIHRDLLEMTVMDPRHIKIYIKPEEFLENARCAGKCKETIWNIHKATPKAKLYYCDDMITGFRAPDADPGKSALECGLVLCVPCHADRELKCNLESGNGDSTHRRSSRRPARK